MSAVLDSVLAANDRYATQFGEKGKLALPPARRFAVLTCMDARIDVFAVLGLNLGEALVIRNAGARVTEDSVRSLALATHALGVNTVAVMQHTKCGLEGVTPELQAAAGADLELLPIDDHHTALRDDIGVLTLHPSLALIETVAGLVYDVETGEIEDVVRWERAPLAM